MSKQAIKAMIDHVAAVADGYMAAKAFRKYRAKCPTSLRRLKFADAVNITQSPQFEFEEENRTHMSELKRLADEYFFTQKRVEATYKTLLDETYVDPVAAKEACDDIRFITQK